MEKLYRRAGFAEAIANADAQQLRGILFRQSLRNRGSQPTDDRVFLDCDHSAAVSGGPDQEVTVQGLDRMHVNDTG